MVEKPLTFIGLLKMIKKNIKVLIIIVLFSTIFSTIISLILPKYYKAETTILVPQAIKSPVSNLSIISELGLSGMPGPQADLTRLMAIFKSRSILEYVAEKLNLLDRYKSKSWESTIRRLRKNIKITLGEESQVKISVFDRDKYLVADIANYLVRYADSIYINLNLKYARDNRIFYEYKINEIKDSLQYLKDKLKRFMEENGVIYLEDQVKIWLEKVADFKALQTSKEIEFEVTRKTYGEESPVTKRLKTEILVLKDKYESLIKNNSEFNLSPEIDELPNLEIEFMQLQKDLEYYYKLLEYLGPQYEQMKLKEVSAIPTIQVLDEAKIPEKKAKPKRAKIVILGFTISLILSIYFIYFKERYTFYISQFK